MRKSLPMQAFLLCCRKWKFYVDINIINPPDATFHLAPSPFDKGDESYDVSFTHKAKHAN